MSAIQLSAILLHNFHELQNIKKIETYINNYTSTNFYLKIKHGTQWQEKVAIERCISIIIIIIISNITSCKPYNGLIIQFWNYH